MEKWVTVAAYLLIVVGIALLFGLTPKRIAEDFGKLFAPRYSLRERALLLSGRKKKSRVSTAFQKMQEALENTGNKGFFGIVCACSVLLFLAGPLLWQLTGSFFVLPVIVLAAVLLPFFVAENALEMYEKRLSVELETALSVVSSAYLRSGNLISAVQESMPNIRPPMSDIFTEFLANANTVTPDLAACIRRMQTRIDHRIFRDWCEVLLACVEDASNRDALLPVVQELSELRLANNEMETVITECRKEYYGMALLTIGSIPLLYFLNGEWWDALVHSVAGQVALSVCGCVLLITLFLMKRRTRPLELQEKERKK